MSESEANDENILKSADIECTYVTTEQLSQNICFQQADLTLFNLNIRSLNKNFDKLNQCLKSINHNFTVIGLTETQLKINPMIISNYKIITWNIWTKLDEILVVFVCT